MKRTKIFTLLAVLLCATTTWSQTEVSTDSELREAIQTGGADITVISNINLSNSTLEIAAGTVTIDLGGGGTGPVLSRDIDLGMDFLLDFDQLE